MGLDAAVLLDAAHPGARFPAAIPGLKPIPGSAGYFDGPGNFHGDFTAVRRGKLWLVVAGAKNSAQRLAVLRHLTATVRS